MTVKNAIELIKKEIDKASTEAETADLDRARYLWGLNDGFRRALEILDGQQ